jgi:hypothetical protein
MVFIVAKKPNQPFKEFITVPNDSSLFNMEKALVDNGYYQYTIEDNEALASLKNDVVVAITSNLTEYDIKKNPHLLLQTTNKNEIINQINKRLDSLEPLTRDLYKALFGHWYENRDLNGDAYIEIEDIHFGYRGLRGTNQQSTLPDDVYEKYVQSFDVLQNTKVKINIDERTNTAHKKITKNDFGAIGSYLINVNHYTYYSHDKNKIRGVSYSMKMLYDTFVKKLNYSYPTSLLQLSTKSEIVKNMGNYFCHLHSLSKENGESVSYVNFYTLMGEAKFEIKGSRYQEYIDRFIKHIEKTEKLLMDSNIVKKIVVPANINTKTYRYNRIIVHWNFPDVLQLEA